jgi:hypothetical protein
MNKKQHTISNLRTFARDLVDGAQDVVRCHYQMTLAESRRLEDWILVQLEQVTK